MNGLEPDFLARIQEPGVAALDRAAAFALLRDETVTEPNPALITERGLYAALGPVEAEAILGALEQAATANPVVARAITWLRPPADGIDLSSAHTRGLLDQLQAGGVLTATQVVALKALGERTRPKWPGLKEGHIQNARHHIAQGV